MVQEKQFTIRQADGQMFGPYTLEQIKQLIREGRVSTTDMVAPVGQTFVPIRSFFELDVLFHEHASTAQIPTELLSGEIGATELLAGLQPVKIILPEKGQSAFATFAGDLHKIPFPRLYYSLFIHQQTGRLLLTQPGDKTREIFFLRGSPWIMRLPSEDDDLAERLLHKGLCSFEQLSDIFAETTKEGGVLLDMLVSRGVIVAGQLYEVIQEQFRTRLLSTFSWKEGRYLFFANERPKENGVPLNLDNLGLIKQGVSQCYQQQYIQWVMEPHYNKLLSKLSHSLITLEQLHFTAKEARMYNLITRGGTLWQFIAHVEQTRVATLEEILQFIYFLATLDMIQINEQTLWPPLTDNLRMLNSTTPPPS